MAYAGGILEPGYGSGNARGAACSVHVTQTGAGGLFLPLAMSGADTFRGQGAAAAKLSGRTPARLIGVFAFYPPGSAPMAVQETGASRAAVERNIDHLSTRGLIREITGQRAGRPLQR